VYFSSPGSGSLAGGRAKIFAVSMRYRHGFVNVEVSYIPHQFHGFSTFVRHSDGIPDAVTPLPAISASSFVNEVV